MKRTLEGIHNLRTVADGAADAWDTAPESHKPILRDCSDALMQAADEIERLRAIVEADDRRFAWLAGGGVDCGPVVEGFSVLLDDFWCFLGDAIRERIGEENDSPDIEGTDEDRIRAFRAMIDAAMAAEKAMKP